VGFGDEELISKLLYGLDQRFETIVNVIEQIDADALVWADIVRRLKNYENLNNNNHQPKSYNTTSRMANAKEDSSAPMLMIREQWRISESKTNSHPTRNNNRRNNNNNRNRTNSNTSAKSQAKWFNFHKVNTHSDQECFFQNRRSSNNNPGTNSRNNIIRNNNNNTEDMDTCLMLKSVQSPNISKKCSNSHSSSFYIDSAASKSYISNLNLFDSFTNKIGTTNVEIGDGSIISTNGIGNIGIFDQIFYGSNLAFNILSVYDLSRHGLHVEFFGNFCRILDGYKNCLLQISRGSDNLFSINIDQVRELSSILESKLSDISAKSEFINSPTSNLGSNDLQNPEIENSDIIPSDLDEPSDLLIADAKDIDPTQLWHCRLGHVNVPGIITCFKNGLVNGENAKFSNLNPKYFCPTCPISKSVVKSFSSDSHNTSNKALDLIFTELCGPYGTKSIGGNIFMITFTDCYSKFV